MPFSFSKAQKSNTEEHAAACLRTSIAAISTLAVCSMLINHKNNGKITYNTNIIINNESGSQIQRPKNFRPEIKALALRLCYVWNNLFTNLTYLWQAMEENKKQKQVGQLLNEEMSDIFQREGINIVGGGMVSITKVMVTPDLLEARIYLSFYQIKDVPELLHKIKERTGEWRKLLGLRVRNQLRRIPQLTFYADDTQDHVSKMDEIFKQINEERKTRDASEDNA